MWVPHPWHWSAWGCRHLMFILLVRVQPGHWAFKGNSDMQDHVGASALGSFCWFESWFQSLLSSLIELCLSFLICEMGTIGTS